MTVGILCEKTTAAEKFAKALGGARGTFDGTSYVIVSASGHLYELDEPQDQVSKDLFKRYNKWDLHELPWDLNDFKWSLKETKGAGPKLAQIKKVLSTCDEIAIATDVDPSGEGGSIAGNILVKQGLLSKPLTRMYFTDEEVPSVQKAFRERKKLQSLDTFDEYLMSQARSKFDLASIQWTRAASLIANLPMVLRNGRLKSAMIVLVGDQSKAHESYVKKPFYTAKFRDENGVLYSDPDQERKEKESDVDLSGLHESAVVVDSKKKKTTAPPKYLDIGALSSMLSRKHGMRPDKVTAIYQAMYQDGVVSYPRTEDRTVTPEQFTELVGKVDTIARLVGVDPALLTHRSPRKTHVVATGAHGANRPGPNVPSSLSSLDSKYGTGASKIYITVAQNFLMSLAEDYVYEQQKAHIEDFPTFTGSANVPLSPGWKAVMDLADDDEKDPDEAKSGVGTRATPFTHEGVPPRPAHPTMTWLMKQLERRGIGTPATQVNTFIEVTKSNRNQIMEHGKADKVVLVDAGKASYALLPGTHIGDIELTKRLFDQMRQVGAGTLKESTILEPIAGWVSEDIEVMKKNAKNLSEMGFKPKAPREIYEGDFGGERVKFNRIFRKVRLDDETCDRLLAGEVVRLDDVPSSTKPGNTYSANVRLAHLEYKGKKYVGIDFIEFVNKPGSIPSRWAGHTFTEKEKADLLAGKTLFIDTFVSRKTKKKYGANIRYTPESDYVLTMEFEDGGKR